MYLSRRSDPHRLSLRRFDLRSSHPSPTAPHRAAPSDPTLDQAAHPDGAASQRAPDQTESRKHRRGSVSSSADLARRRAAFDAERPPIILGFSVHGGVGNQIYDMLEALYLVRHTRSVLLLPAVLPRTDIEGDASSARNRARTRVWDLRRLSEGTQGRPIYPFLPSRCRNRIHVLYLFVRRNARGPPPGRVPAEVRNAACVLAAAAPRAHSVCPDLFANTLVHVRRQNLTAGGDPSFIRELAALRAAPPTHRSPSDPLCVWVSGHSYDRAGADGDEYLYAHMHFLAAHPRIAAAARRWPLPTMAVVHVRYDEELCGDADEHDASHVCVRVHKDGAHKNPLPPIYWAPVSSYVTAIANALREERVASIYIAASPYVPVKTVVRLQEELGKRLRVERMASTVYDDEADINFLERELAIMSKVFIGDFGSTWSGTVYFKRRTLGTSTLWTNVLLGKAGNLGYYTDNSTLEMPD